MIELLHRLNWPVVIAVLFFVLCITTATLTILIWTIVFGVGSLLSAILSLRI